MPKVLDLITKWRSEAGELEEKAFYANAFNKEEEAINLVKRVDELRAAAKVLEEEYKSTTKERTPLEKIDDMVKAQCTQGTWDHSPYMHGMANGMLLIQATLNGAEFVPLEAPDIWLKDIPAPKYEEDAAPGSQT